MAVSDWSTTNSANTTIGAISIAEGCPPGSINDAIREVMAELAVFFGIGSGGGIGVTAGGTGATTAAQARTNLSAAASGANADITSLTGLTTPLAGTEGGTGMTGVQSALSAATTGYFKTYSGIIIQWGTCVIGNGGSTFGASYNFPAAFPNAAWTIVATPAGRANTGWRPISLNFPVLNQTGFGIEADSGNSSQPITSGVAARWIAIGN